MTAQEELKRLESELQKANDQYQKLIADAKNVRDVMLRMEGGIVTLKAVLEEGELDTQPMDDEP